MLYTEIYKKYIFHLLCRNLFSLIILLHDIQPPFWFATPYNNLPPLWFQWAKFVYLWSKSTSKIIIFKYFIIFPRPISDQLLFNSCYIYLETASGLNDHLHKIFQNFWTEWPPSSERIWNFGIFYVLAQLR